MPFYLPSGDAATDQVIATFLAPVEQRDVDRRQAVAGPPAGMVAVRMDGLVDTGRGRGGGALINRDASGLATGQEMVFCHPVAHAPVAVRRDGRLQAQGWLPDHVRLGILEHHLGIDTIERLVADPRMRTRPGQRRRTMSLPLTARFVLAMTLLPRRPR